MNKFSMGDSGSSINHVNMERGRVPEYYINQSVFGTMKNKEGGGRPKKFKNGVYGFMNDRPKPIYRCES